MERKKRSDDPDSHSPGVLLRRCRVDSLEALEMAMAMAMAATGTVAVELAVELGSL